MSREALEIKIKKMMRFLDERQLRLYLGSEAEALGHGGITIVSEISGKNDKTISLGIQEINSGDVLSGRVRKAGGGRKSIKEKYPEIEDEIEKIVSDSTYGSPEKALSYTTLSLRKIQNILNGKGYEIGHDVVGDILEGLGYSLQLNQKMLQVGESHPDRNTQFEFINEKSKQFLNAGDPVISIDAKKKELIGNFKNNGRVYRKKKDPVKVLDHDFPIAELGKVTPYGVYDIGQNRALVNLGISKDTSEFAVESIVRWWLTVGKNTYPAASKIYINCDAGGSNSYKSRVFKRQLQEFADQSGLEIHTSHLPPGTSKWNKIEHKLFCYISSNWRGQPLISVEATIDLIGSTTTTKGLKVKCVKDDRTYELGVKVSKKEFEAINIKRDAICPNWNYIISPRESP